MTQDFDHIVLGAGISGLGAAHFAVRRGLRTLVLDSAPRLGGCIHTHVFQGLDGFWTEAGSHCCFNSYGNLLQIMDDLGLTAQAAARAKVRYRLWRDGRRRSIASAFHFLEAAVSMPRVFTTSREGRRVADYYARILGQRNYRDVLRHAFQSVICQPADDYPAEALFRRRARRKTMNRAFTFVGGLSGIPVAIAAQDGLEVRTGQTVAAVFSEAPGFRVVTEAGEFTCDYLTLAVPPDAAARLIPAGYEAAADAAGVIGMAGVETLTLAFRAKDLELPALAGLIAVDEAFYSAVSRDFLPDPGHRGFAFHFRPGVLCHEDQVAVACRSLGADPASIAGRGHVVNRLPRLRIGHAGLVRRIDQAIAGSRLGITGNWFLGISIEDALTRSRHEACRLFGGDRAGT